jgi:hypothetical protein
MIQDYQVRRLQKLVQTEQTQAIAASKAGMDEKTARKYLRAEKLPSEHRTVHTWRTREDPFKDVWGWIRGMLSINSGLEAKTLFEELQRQSPGRFSDGQLRTLQRQMKRWRALEGPEREVFFAQEHSPGVLCESDFTHMESLAVTIGGMRFDHMLYHLVLTYSNWETVTICFSESFESLSDGLQNALWELGGVPHAHQTDRLTAAVQKTSHPDEFTQRYNALLRHYTIEGKKTNRNSPNENGDVEQGHYRLKRAVDQALMLRGSRDFATRKDYGAFLRTVFHQRNSGRKKRFQEELAVLGALPSKRLDADKRVMVKVGPSSTIRVNHNTYSVNSRLIGEAVDVHLHAECLDVYYAQRCVERLPRLRGEGGRHIQYRHIIEWLVRKPGAFENYRYRNELFPTHRFRVAYDQLKEHAGARANKSYVSILHRAARDGEALVDNALKRLIDTHAIITDEVLTQQMQSLREATSPKSHEVVIMPVDLPCYDALLVTNVIAMTTHVHTAVA